MPTIHEQYFWYYLVDVNGDFYDKHTQKLRLTRAADPNAIVGELLYDIEEHIFDCDSRILLSGYSSELEQMLRPGDKLDSHGQDPRYPLWVVVAYEEEAFDQNYDGSLVADAFTADDAVSEASVGASLDRRQLLEMLLTFVMRELHRIEQTPPTSRKRKRDHDPKSQEDSKVGRREQSNTSSSLERQQRRPQHCCWMCRSHQEMEIPCSSSYRSSCSAYAEHASSRQAGRDRTLGGSSLMESTGELMLPPTRLQRK